MPLEIRPPLPPMEALSVDAIPQGKEWQNEPKWDGFRCLAFRDGSIIELQSKSQQPLARYFPELVSSLSELKARRFVLDGEIALPEGGNFSFDALLQRIHPAASRVKLLATRTPAIFLVFDLLATEDGQSLMSRPLSERRRQLEQFAAKFFGKVGSVRLSPATSRLADAKKWLAQTATTTASSPSAEISTTVLVNGTECRRSKTFAAQSVSLAAFATGKEPKWSVRSSSASMRATAYCITLVSLPVSPRPTAHRLQRNWRSSLHRLVSRALLPEGPVAGIKARKTSGIRLVRARRRSLLRSCYRRSFPPWHQVA